MYAKFKLKVMLPDINWDLVSSITIGYFIGRLCYSWISAFFAAIYTMIIEFKNLKKEIEEGDGI